jgi:KDO2-lipid IV(A) lauroyltransferase
MIPFLKFLQFIFRFIFLLPGDFALARMRGTANFVYRIARKTKIKRILANNIKLVLPESGAEKLSDKLLKNTSLSVFEILCLPFFKKEHYQSIVQWHGLENLNRALAEKMGVITLTIHAGNYEIISPALAHLGYKMNIIQKTTDDPVFQIVNRSRSASGTKMINVLEQDMYKETFKILKRNEIIGHLADTGALESRHISVRFLGKEVPAATGWLTLAQRAKCPVIPILARRDGNINHITLYEPFIITKENRKEIMQKTLKIFEDFVQQNPQEWLIFLNSYETERMMGLRD